MELRKTKQRLHTLEILAEMGAAHGFEIATKASMSLGTVYGILMAFEERGFVESRWEENPPGGRPLRKFYRLTPSGIELLKEYQAHFGPEISRGFFQAATEDLHTAIDQVWGGIFAVSVRREHERQAQAAADAKKK